MSKRTTWTSTKTPFYPPNDQATHRDLLLFEERLKTNALILNRRKSRYLWFLAQLISLILFLCCEVFLQTSFLSIPYRLLLGNKWDADLYVHSYVAPGLLLVAATTLVLFFASGLYSEKVAYANQYVPHANKALRSFNMYLNTRKASRGSLYNPLTYIFPRAKSPSTSTSPSSSPPSSRPRTPSPIRLGKRPPSSAPIPSIPPTTNPRGELIFSSRVDRGFRESYERYRAAFERKREERERLAAARTWTGWISQKMPWNAPPPLAPPQSPGSLTPNQPHSRTPSTSLRGRAGTPGSSRRSSPVPQSPPPPERERGRSSVPFNEQQQQPPRAAGYM